MKLSIPTIYVVGIIVFLLLPQELWTPKDFVIYMSSLSTIIMVFIYIFTTSWQLSAMRSQLAEMQYSRNVQSQPLVSFDEMKMRIQTPRYYWSPTTKFRKLNFGCVVLFEANVTNIGNSPAIAADLIPTIVSVKEETLLDTSIGGHIDCLSLREGDKKNILIMFHDWQHRIVEALVSDDAVLLRLVTVYKNALGMPFKEQIDFLSGVKSEERLEKLKLCLKITKTAGIDFAEKVREFHTLAERGMKEKSHKVLKKMNKKLEKVFGKEDEFEFSMDVYTGSFSVEPISQTEYEELVAQKVEMEKRLVAPWKKVPWFFK